MSTPITENEMGALKASKGQGQWAGAVQACKDARAGELPSDWAAKVEGVNLRSETLRRPPPDAPWATRLAKGQKKAGKPSHVRTVEQQAVIDADFDDKPRRERVGELQGKVTAGNTLTNEQSAELEKIAS